MCLFKKNRFYLNRLVLIYLYKRVDKNLPNLISYLDFDRINTTVVYLRYHPFQHGKSKRLLVLKIQANAHLTTLLYHYFTSYYLFSYYSKRNLYLYIRFLQFAFQR